MLKLEQEYPGSLDPAEDPQRVALGVEFHRNRSVLDLDREAHLATEGLGEGRVARNPKAFGTTVPLDDVRGGAGGDDLSEVDDRDPVRQKLGLFEVVRCQEDRPTLRFETPENRPDRAHGRGGRDPSLAHLGSRVSGR